MRKASFALMSVFLVIGALLQASTVQPAQELGTAPVPEIAEMIAQISEAKIHNTVLDLQNFVTRAYGKSGNVVAATYLHNKLMAISPRLVVQYQGSYNNVIATLPGLDNVTYIVGAHYDSVSSDPNNAPGALDDAAGVAIVLEFARIMSQYNFSHTLKFACWNREESGFIGSLDYAAYASGNSLNIPLYVNLDSPAYDPYGRFILDIMYNSQSTWAANTFTEHNSLYGIDFTLTYNVHGCGSDHRAFWQYGYTAVMTHEETHGPAHTPDDTIDKVSTIYAKKNGQLCMSVIAKLAEPLSCTLPTLEYGVNYLATWWHYEPPPDGHLSETVLRNDFECFRAQGLKYVTLAVIWKYTEPSIGNYSKSALNDLRNVCGIAAEYGLEVIIDFHTMMNDGSFTIPDWVSPRKFETVFTNNTIRRAWLNFLGNCTKELNGENVSSWHMMNEPALGEWACNVSISDFASLWREMKTVIRASSPNATVSIRFSAYTFNSPKHFGNETARAEIYDICDYVALNWYDSTSLNQSKHDTTHCLASEELENLVHEIRDNNREVMISEFGYDKTNSSDEQKAAYQQYLQLFRSTGVSSCIAWLWRSDHNLGDPDQPDTGFNLAQHVTNGTTYPRPAFELLHARVSVSLSGWNVDPLYTNASYALSSSVSSLYLELDATDTSSRVTIFNPNISKLSLSDYTYIDVAVFGTNNAKILLRFFLDDGTGFDVVYWQSPATLNALNFDLSPYAGRTLNQVYIALMSSDGTTANITITQIAFVTQALLPTIPLSGWQEDPTYTNATYVLNSNPSSLYLELDATDTNSRVTIFNLNIPRLSLSDYTQVNTTVSGTDNARILLRFFLDDRSGFDIVWWGSPAALNATKFDLTPYAGRTLSQVYIALISSDGTTTNLTITQIEFSTRALPSMIPLAGWVEDPVYTNAPYVLSSSASSLFLELDATDTSSRVTISQPIVPRLHLSDYAYVNATVSGTENAKILLRFFLDDGSGFDVVWWQSPATLDAIRFDLSPYAGRTLNQVYIALMSANGTLANINVTQIAFAAQAPLSPFIPLSGWQMDPLYTNAPYVLSSSPSSLYLQLDATNTNSRVTIYNFDIPKLSLSDYTYINTTVSGTGNAKILLRFFLDDGTGFDVVWWGSPATLNAVEFDLTPYAGRTLNQVYVALMSSDGTQANITITQIEFVHA